MEKLRSILKIFIVTLALFVTLCSCSSGDIRDYRERGFSSSLLLSWDELKITARIDVGIPNENGKRLVRIDLLSPETLSGISLCQDGDKRYILCEDLQISEEQLKTMFVWLDLILPIGELKITGKLEANGSSVITAYVGNSNMHIDPNTHAPVEIYDMGKRVTFEHFEFY